jgi:hypothetical protein
MKKTIICVILVVAFFGIFSAISAEENETRTKIQVHKKTGEVRFVNEDPNWRDATEEEMLAVRDPGKVIAVDFETFGERDGLLYVLIRQKSEKALIFENDKMKVLYDKTEKVGKKKFFPIPLFLILSFILIVIANFLYFRSENTVDGFLFAAIGLFIIFLIIEILLSAWHIIDFVFLALFFISVLVIPWSRRRGILNSIPNLNLTILEFFNFF